MLNEVKYTIQFRPMMQQVLKIALNKILVHTTNQNPNDFLPFVQGVLGQGGDRIRRAEWSRLLPERGQSLCLGFWNCLNLPLALPISIPSRRADSCRSGRGWPRPQRLATSDRETSSAFWTSEYRQDTYNDKTSELVHQLNIEKKWQIQFVFLI